MQNHRFGGKCINPRAMITYVFWLLNLGLESAQQGQIFCNLKNTVYSWFYVKELETSGKVVVTVDSLI